jgi:hypothetical protein
MAASWRRSSNRTEALLDSQVQDTSEAHKEHHRINESQGWKGKVPQDGDRMTL